MEGSNTSFIYCFNLNLNIKEIEGMPQRRNCLIVNRILMRMEEKIEEKTEKREGETKEYTKKTRKRLGRDERRDSEEQIRN